MYKNYVKIFHVLHRALVLYLIILFKILMYLPSVAFVKYDILLQLGLFPVFFLFHFTVALPVCYVCCLIVFVFFPI